MLFETRLHRKEFSSHKSIVGVKSNGSLVSHEWRFQNTCKGRFGYRLTRIFIEAGFGSNDSMWLTPPIMKSQITLLARAIGCSKVLSMASAPSRCSKAVRATLPKPKPFAKKAVFD